ncbi:proteasome assembly chaperone family protein [Haloarchaeobius sp. FL176]|uniref:proteasome assembly chaperone family protein n=1 Tax=Haloarchaeobius sp. FL176 TaxID=2967129 RepID=UPI00214817FC|nr:PAC2 family protein [Haloarchaeobius sp. FL176]
MGHIQQHAEMDVDGAMLVEGMPGVGLVGKIATDHLVDEFDMELYGTVHCDSLAPIGVYHEGERTIQPPVRIYAAPDEDLVALQSDIPVNSAAVAEFADCLVSWLDEENVTPIFLSGLPAEKSGVPELFGIATGDAGGQLDDVDIDVPPENGVVSGPTGAFLNEAGEVGLDGVGLVVQSNERFPDPEAARVLIEHGIGTLTGIEVDISELVDRAEEIRKQKEKLAEKMRKAKDEESSQAQPLRMYQ